MGERVDVSSNLYESVTSSTTNLGSSKFYIVNSDVEITSRITCSGNVDLILQDGCTLTASAGITVNSGNSLTIYGQSEGTGTLNAGVGADTVDAAIGALANNSGGTITINGGIINATGPAWAAAIGGGYNGKGTVVINGGVVNASAQTIYEYEVSYEYYADIGGVGIGGGQRGEADVTINGGTVNADGGERGAGIGSIGVPALSQDPGKSDIKINGGKTTVSAAYGQVCVGGTAIQLLRSTFRNVTALSDPPGTRER